MKRLLLVFVSTAVLILTGCRSGVPEICDVKQVDGREWELIWNKESVVHE